MNWKQGRIESFRDFIGRVSMLLLKLLKCVLHSSLIFDILFINWGNISFLNAFMVISKVKIFYKIVCFYTLSLISTCLLKFFTYLKKRMWLMRNQKKSKDAVFLNTHRFFVFCYKKFFGIFKYIVKIKD